MLWQTLLLKIKFASLLFAIGHVWCLMQTAVPHSSKPHRCRRGRNSVTKQHDVSSLRHVVAAASLAKAQTSTRELTPDGEQQRAKHSTDQPSI